MDAVTGTQLWAPTTERAGSTNLAAFARTNGFEALDYEALHRWSVAEPADFWRAVWDGCGIVGDPGDTVVLPSDDIAATRFFPNASLNVAENLLARLPDGEGVPAVIAYDEHGHVSSLAADDLRRAVASFAAVLREAGVGVGDRVCAMLPNGPEAVITMLGAASIGAVYSSASPDFGVSAVLDRFEQIEPVVFVGCAEYTYAGKLIDTSEKLVAIAAGLGAARLCVVTGHRGIDGFQPWQQLLAAHPDTPLQFERLPFDHPWYVLFSSGTTGKPKCIVHRAGGVLLMHAKEHRLHCDIRPGDVVTYYTTTGWMMWNWLVSALATGATIEIGRAHV